MEHNRFKPNELLYFIKYKNAPAAFQNPFRLFGFSIIKFKILRSSFIWWIFKKKLLTYIIDEVGGLVGATPEGMGYHILLSVKITLDAGIYMF